MDRLIAINRVLTALLESIMVVLFAVFLIIVCAKVLMRPFDAAIYGVDELVKMSFLTTSALGGAVAISRREHIAITVFIDQMPHTIKVSLYILGLALVGAMNGLLVYLSFDWIAGPGKNIWQPFGMPQSYVFVIVPLACSLAVLFCAIKIALTLSGDENTDILWMPED
ncbi:TRAP transporter small permease [Rhodobacteraceae bacterium B1Z28]|uniref:TRAP transporter small permease protein n=1 Tax=Ruegeria haliotis TaxID=2747601 RepID=A0ABX2PUU8_9RHOB|nr:TRAP transporter small permease subunit [Ruegeria haliotis]NVO57926.1 TRAP transporter small permease [Ruegeria haliotis]